MTDRAERSMVDTSGLSEHEKAWEHLALTYLTLRRARDVELRRVGLTMPQATILDIVQTSKEPLTPMKLARRMNRQPHTVSALVSRMEAEGLLKTTRDLARKNWIRVSLTRKGKEAWRRQAWEKSARNATACLSEEELTQLNAICRKLRARGVQLVRQLQPIPYSDSSFVWG